MPASWPFERLALYGPESDGMYFVAIGVETLGEPQDAALHAAYTHAQHHMKHAGATRAARRGGSIVKSQT